MNQTPDIDSSPSPPAILPPLPALEPAAPHPAPARWQRLVSFVWKFFVGVLFTQFILGSLLAVGWTLRAMQRLALQTWWKQSACGRNGASFEAWLASADPAHPHRHWPNWVLQQNFPAAWKPDPALGARRRLRHRLGALGASLRLNLRLGLQGLFNVWLLTLPGCLLMLFSWYDGWNNSFNKGYEQAVVGPLTGLLGILLFVLAMLYAPLAQARQAVTGDWKTFYQFGLVWGLVRRHWLAGLLLAVAYSAASVPLTILKSAPMFFAQGNPAIEQFTAAEVVGYLNGYFFRCGLLVFPLWVLLRLAAARLYARAMLKDVQKGLVEASRLAPVEQRELRRLDLLQSHPPRARHVLLQAAARTGAGLLGWAGLAAVGLVWFSFIAQVYVAEFFMYHPVAGWLHQPLAHFPWFRYIPPQAENPGHELVGAALLLGILYLGRPR